MVDKIALEDNQDDAIKERSPQFTNTKKMLKTVVKPAGNMISLKCKATGYPTPTVKWKKNDEEPKRHLGNIRYGSWSITLEDLVTDDSGTYTCYVCNKLGCISHDFTVDVVGKFYRWYLNLVELQRLKLKINFIPHSKQSAFLPNRTLKKDIPRTLLY